MKKRSLTVILLLAAFILSAGVVHANLCMQICYMMDDVCVSKCNEIPSWEKRDLCMQKCWEKLTICILGCCH